MPILGFFKKGPERYALMQKLFYSQVDPANDGQLKAVIGNYKSHQRYPYEKHLLKYVENPKEKIGLEFGCGPGRMILRMDKLMKRVDGVDISEPLIQAAKEWTKELIPAPPSFTLIRDWI